MMKFSSSIVVLLFFQLFVIAQPSKKVAVYVMGENAGINKVLEGKLVNELSRSGKYIAIERTSAFLVELGKEQKYQRTGAVDDNEISRLGRQFGIQYVCVAEVSDAFGEKYVSARLIDVETAAVANSHGVGGTMNNMNDCLRIANEIAMNLSKGTFTEQAQKAEDERIAAFRQDYLNLGLPSGTLWKATNENGYYTFDEAVEKYGDLLPTAEQWVELMNYCKWEWSKKDFALKVTGDDGKYFFLPPLGGRDCAGDKFDIKGGGYYWTSSLRRKGDGCYFLFKVNGVIEYGDGMMYSGKTCLGFPVHLVLSDAQERKSKVQEYVDLGLPSGTLWKTYNENGFYDYDSAVKKFGEAIPTAGQWTELRECCKWEWRGAGYKITGQNGKCIILPAMGVVTEGFEYVYIGDYGFYWGTHLEKDAAHRKICIYLNSKVINGSRNFSYQRLSVRLVQNP